ncbi:preprotein translocase subunit YajC [Lagierella sp.]|uniref:preprotein translocase subunit YajC n=1 Tax=Lagierella sp. TaxID=2849657 RepID=UPI0026360FC4|nr:preprotein translocase subunit YajC [Lagierella sp.]
MVSGNSIGNSILGASIALIFLIFIIVIIYYFVANSKLKKQKEHFSNVHQNLKVGSKVIFSNGIYGKIIKIDRDTVDVEVKSKAVMTVSRYSISSIVD